MPKKFFEYEKLTKSRFSSTCTECGGIISVDTPIFFDIETKQICHTLCKPGPIYPVTKKKYEITDQTIVVKGVTLHRIRALTSFGSIPYRNKFLRDIGKVREGELGGYIEDVSNLSQTDRCWIFDEGKAYGYSKVSGQARLFQEAEIFEHASMSGMSQAFDTVKIYGHSKLLDKVKAIGASQIFDYATVGGYTKVRGNSRIFGKAVVFKAKDSRPILNEDISE